MAESKIVFLLVLSLFGTMTRAGDLNLHYEEPLLSEFYNELTCPKEPVPLFEGKIRYLWLFAPGSWYMPMASEKVYRQVAEVLLARPARSQAELDLLDLKVRGFLSAPRITGFATKSFRKFCVPINRPIKAFPKNLLEVTCFALWGSRGTDLKPAARGVDSINWTDNENAVLITPCAGHDFNWFVLSKRPTISDEAKATILHRISALGFNPHKANYYDYENKRFVKHHKGIPVVVHEPEIVVPPHSHSSYHDEPEEVVAPPHNSYHDQPEIVVPPQSHSSYYTESSPNANAVSIAPKSPFYYPQQSFVTEPRQYSEYQVSHAADGMYFYHKK